MRMLVTGCNGVLGRALASRLLEVRPDYEVFGIDLTQPVGIQGMARDLADLDVTRRAVVRIEPDVVFHCAGSVSGRDITTLAQRILVPTQALVKALELEVPAAVFVLPGSVTEYGTLPTGHLAFSEDDDPAPASPYGVVKVAQTGIALKAADAGLDARVGRVFDLIGPGSPPSLIPGRVASQLALIAAGEAEPRIELGVLSGVRDYVDIRDACDGLIAVAEHGVFGRIYNICSGVRRTPREAVEALVRCSGLEVEVAEERRGAANRDPDASVGDPSRAARELKWHPVIDFEASACDAVSAARAELEESEVP